MYNDWNVSNDIFFTTGFGETDITRLHYEGTESFVEGKPTLILYHYYQNTNFRRDQTDLDHIKSQNYFGGYAPAIGDCGRPNTEPSCDDPYNTWDSIFW